MDAVTAACAFELCVAWMMSRGPPCAHGPDRPDRDLTHLDHTHLDHTRNDDQPVQVDISVDRTISTTRMRELDEDPGNMFYCETLNGPFPS